MNNAPMFSPIETLDQVVMRLRAYRDGAATGLGSDDLIRRHRAEAAVEATNNALALLADYQRTQSANHEGTQA